MQITKIKEDKINIFCHWQELEDLRSALSLAIELANEIHRDSPKFRKSLHKIERSLWKVQHNKLDLSVGQGEIASRRAQH